MYKIYVLKNPMDNEIRYVGVTTVSLNARLSQHLYDAKNKKGTHKTNWIFNLIKNGLKPIIELLEECDANSWEQREMYYISSLPNLTNTHEGGKGVIINRRGTSIERSAQSKYKKIVQLSKTGEFIKIWDAAIIASKKLNISNSSIGNVLYGRSATAGGYRWIMYKDYKNGTYSLKVINSPNAIAVIDEDGREWTTITELCKHLNIKHETLVKYIDKKPYKGKLYKYKTKI